MMQPDLILHNARITTLDRAAHQAQAVAIANGSFVAAGRDGNILPLAGPRDADHRYGRRLVLPGLIDNHTHVGRGGLNSTRHSCGN